VCWKLVLWKKDFLLLTKLPKLWKSKENEEDVGDKKLAWQRMNYLNWFLVLLIQIKINLIGYKWQVIHPL
jgi:hypothetical protein